MAPVVVLLVIWTLAGFVPALAPVAWLIWGSAAVSSAALLLYTTYRFYQSILGIKEDIARLSASQAANEARISEVDTRIWRLEAVAGQGRDDAAAPGEQAGLETHSPNGQETPGS